MANNDLKLGTLRVTVDQEFARASFDLPDGSSIVRNFPPDGELKMNITMGMVLGSGAVGVPVPANTVLPVISGMAIEGQTLSTTNGTWANSPDSYAYQWKDDGVAISGATASTYVLTSAEAGGVITVTVTATNEGGSASATSAGTDAVAALPEPNWNSVVFLSSFDGVHGAFAATDDSNSAHAITFSKTGSGICELDTSRKVFGVSSVRISSESGYAGLVIADHADFDPSGDYTWEGRFNFDVEIGTVQTLFGKYNGVAGENSFIIHYRPGDSLLRFTYTTDGTNALTVDVPFNAVADTWYAIACTKVGSEILWHVGGIYLGKDALAGAIADTPANFVIGNFGSSTTTDLHGFADEIRLTKGVARYGETNYMVDTAAFPRL